MTPDAETALCRAALRGEETAWRALYDAVACDLARAVRWRCGGLRDLADDAIQETWLTAARHLARFDSQRGRFRDWIGGLARNVVRNLLRGDRRRQNGRLTMPGDIPEPCTEPDREAARRVAEALAVLPDEYEAVLQAKYVDGLTVEAIAAKNRETCKAVESRLTRAREAFREWYTRGDS